MANLYFLKYVENIFGFKSNHIHIICSLMSTTWKNIKFAVFCFEFALFINTWTKQIKKNSNLLCFQICCVFELAWDYCTSLYQKKAELMSICNITVHENNINAALNETINCLCYETPTCHKGRRLFCPTATV